MGKTKKIFTNFRVILTFIVVLLAIVAIHPNPWADGVSIRSVAPDSPAYDSGIESPKPSAAPMSRERIIIRFFNIMNNLTKIYKAPREGFY